MRSEMRFATAALLLFGLNSTGAWAQEHKIGVIAPTTGPLTFLGSRMYASYQWWEHETNRQGGIKGRQIKLIHCNDEGSPEKAVTCARDLIAQGVLLLINSSVTGPVKATVPLVSNGPVMLVVSPNIEPEPGTNVFQVSATDAEITKALASYLKENKVQRFGVVASTDATGEVGLKSMESVFPGTGIALDVARIDLRATDASSQLVKVVRPDTGAIYVYYSGGGAATVVKSYGNLGLDKPVIINYANISDTFISLIKDDMPKRLLGLGVRAAVPDLLKEPGEKERILHFARSYQAWRGERIDHLNVLGLGAADTADAILRNVANVADVAAVRSFLQSTPIKSYQTIRFSPSRNIGMDSSDIAVIELKGGTWAKADPLK